MEKYNLNNIYLSICFLIPILLITGPFLPDLVVSISIFFLIYIKNNPNFKTIIRNKLFIILIIFYFFSIISSLLSDEVLFSLKSSFLNLRFLIFASVFSLLIFNNLTKLKFLFAILLVSFCALSIDGFIQYTFGENILGYNQPSEGRLSSLFDDRRVLGSYLSKLYPLLLSIYFILGYEKNRKITLFFLFLTIIVTNVILLSGERASFYHHLIFILIVLPLFLLKNKAKIISVSVIFLCILVFTIFSNDYLKMRMYKNIKNSINDKVIFTVYHQEHFFSAYKIFLDNKFLGIGPKMFRHVCDEDRYRMTEEKFETQVYNCSTHPHNTYVQLLSETGIIGFSLIICIFFIFFFQLMKCFYWHLIKGRKYIENYEIAIFSGFFVYLFPISPHGNFFNNWLNVFLALYVAFYLVTVLIKSKKNY